MSPSFTLMANHAHKWGEIIESLWDITELCQTCKHLQNLSMVIFHFLIFHFHEFQQSVTDFSTPNTEATE